MATLRFMAQKLCSLAAWFIAGDKNPYTQSLRVQLRDTPLQVVEIIPPYVQTELGGSHQMSDLYLKPRGW
jgi:hypothetical protein